LSVGPEGPGPGRKNAKRKPLNLSISIRESGIRVGARGVILPPQGDCAQSGPTLCLAEPSTDVADEVESLRNAYSEGDDRRGDELLQRIIDAYDWKALYNKLVEIKKKLPDETEIKVAVQDQLPHALTVRALDVVRYRLERDSYENRQAFCDAERKTEVRGEQRVGAPLFPDPILAW